MIAQTACPPVYFPVLTRIDMAFVEGGWIVMKPDPPGRTAMRFLRYGKSSGGMGNSVFGVPALTFPASNLTSTAVQAKAAER